MCHKAWLIVLGQPENSYVLWGWILTYNTGDYFKILSVTWTSVQEKPSWWTKLQLWLWISLSWQPKGQLVWKKKLHFLQVLYCRDAFWVPGDFSNTWCLCVLPNSHWKVFLHLFASSQTWGSVNALTLSLHECALHCWFFLIFMKWNKLYHSSGRNEESLNWKQLFCLWSSNARILEEMRRGGDANMYVWWRKCFEVMQLSQFLLFSQQMCQDHYS